MKPNGFALLDYRIIVAKSANHFRAWWTDIASEIILPSRKQAHEGTSRSPLIRV